MQSRKIRWALDEYNDIHKILDVTTIYKLNNIIIKKTDNKYVCDLSSWHRDQVLIYRSYKYNK